MHHDELDLEDELVAGLIDSQFPQWAGLELAPLLPWGTDNALFRLGDDKLLRLPRRERSTGQVEKDVRWLPVLAPRLPVAIPEVLAVGRPADGYPWTWGVYRRLVGETLPADRLEEAGSTAGALARFLIALRSVGTDGGPAGISRGVPLVVRDEAARAAIAELGDQIDGRAATALWEEALGAPDWDREPTWIHGDLMPGNILIDNGQLAGVIDWSLLSVGDPACDLMMAWMFLDALARERLRAELEVDDASWERGRGWALSSALIALPYYRETNRPFADYARRTLAEIGVAVGPGA